jgi:serine/threonine-protein kinase HipA
MTITILNNFTIRDTLRHELSWSHFTFFTKRFDRLKHKRIHFASTMTMTGNNEEIIKDNYPSLLIMNQLK